MALHFNILPLDTHARYDLKPTSIELALMEFPEVREAIDALKEAGRNLFPVQLSPDSTSSQQNPSNDLMDRLGYLFSFQKDNVRNQREHVVLLLANHLLRSGPHPKIENSVEFLHKKLLGNYMQWCDFLDQAPNLKPTENLKLAYCCLYLLIWGEAANLRFMPECLCYIFHHMAKELNEAAEACQHIRIRVEAVEAHGHTSNTATDDTYPKPFSHGGDIGFLNKVIRPIYNAVRDEARASNNGTAPHSSWRNYDDMNEFFWSKRCFAQLKWLESGSDYLTNVPREVTTTKGTEGYGSEQERGSGRRSTSFKKALSGGQSGRKGRKESDSDQENDSVRRSTSFKKIISRSPSSKQEKEKKIKMTRDKKMGYKVGFVEQRSFWHIFHSFHRLWIAQLLTLQVLITLAFSGEDQPWVMLFNRNIQARLLYIFVTWAALRAVQALLTIIMQFTLISRNHKLLALRMVLKLLAALTWITIFCLMLARAEEQSVRDKGWSMQANLLLLQFLGTAGVFLLPEMLAMVVLIVPWLVNFTERSNLKLFHILEWWFHTRSYVGRGMHQSLIHTLKYTVFWLVIFAAKISFSYYLQFRPMVKPTRQLLALKNINFTWHQFFTNHNKFEVAVMWAPVILIYLMDMHIWFCIFSAVVGVMVGLFSHIGEIRNLQQFKQRFPFLASAITFNLLPGSQEQSFSRLFKDMLKRLKIRYGLDRDFQQYSAGDPQAQKFAVLWNCIISYFREEDVISNIEEIVLKIPTRDAVKNDKKLHNWPAVLFSNEIAAAVRLAKKYKNINRDTEKNKDKIRDTENKNRDTEKLWEKIKRKSDYGESAVQEAFYSLKYILLEDIWKVSDEGSSDNTRAPETRQELAKIINDIEESCKGKNKTFLKQYNADELENVISSVLELLEALLEVKLENIIVALLNLKDVLVNDFPNKTQGSPKNTKGSAAEEEQLLKMIQVPDLEKHSQLIRLQYIIDTKKNMADAPKNLDARRRLAFFSNSVFMTMPRASSVKRMPSFSVLTPYFNEEVIYSTEQLNAPNEDGINISFYLQQVFPDEWKNSKERIKDELKKTQVERKWASYRGQTLARTVRGMMYYQRALEVLAHLENSQAGTESVESFHKLKITDEEKATALLKFSYVVACQAYQESSETAKPKSNDIKELMKEYPSLRIAYVSEESRPEKKYYSVLAKCDPGKDNVVEVYKILLPGPFKLGEGKPENQNQAIIFTRGEGLQAIDMNQDNYFEEALKVRNLLEEFNTKKDEDEVKSPHEVKKPRILGIREYVFTGSVSSLASFMSAQETSFVTLSQRVLANPLRIRMHYGHPDMFDRLWFLSRGGISKASKTINISEDIYAGFNCTLRGGHVTHHEYIQVGKGRDVGMNQITMFEAKISGGNGEQMMSRDVYRLGHRLDFFRMFSFYYTTVGFYVSSLIVILAAYAFLWGRVYLALSGIEAAIKGDALTNSALTAALNEQLVVQIGIFNSLPMIVENSLEWGFTAAAWHFLLMMLQLCFVFYTYSLGTKGHYFGRTLLHGGAIYKSTGRDFVVKRENFVTIYRYHSRSHFIKGVELIILLIIYAKYSIIAKNNMVYTLMTLSYWFLALTWIMAPFLFNPSVFDWLQTVYDYEDFQTWLWRREGVATKAEESWEVWWNEEQEHFSSTGVWGRMLEVVLSIRFFLIQYGMVYWLKIAAHNKSILVYLVSWIYIVVAIVIYIVVARAKERYGAKQHIYYRSIQCFVISFVAMVIVLLVEVTYFEFDDLFVSMIGFIPTGWGLLNIAAVGKPFLENRAVWRVVVEVARLYDLILGLIVLAPVAVLSWLPGFQNMQTRILFNQAFSRGLQISRLLSGKKITYRGSY